MDSSGAILDRWTGYQTPARWTRNFDSALADLSTAEDKEKRFKAAPSETLAAALGRIHGAQGEIEPAIGFYREAARLAGGPKPEYASAIFNQQLHGFLKGGSKLEDLRASADAVMTLADADAADKLFVAASMADVATDKKDASLFAPYYEPALAASSSVTDGFAKDLRSAVEIAGALQIKKDTALAVALKKQSMPAGWEEKAGKLRGFASWCFQKQVNLEEGERLARKGIEIAEPGPERAEILDLAAEICNLLGNCDDAVTLAQRALKEDPKEEHYAKQVKRFAELRDKKKAGTGA